MKVWYTLIIEVLQLFVIRSLFAKKFKFLFVIREEWKFEENEKHNTKVSKSTAFAEFSTPNEPGLCSANFFPKKSC